MKSSLLRFTIATFLSVAAFSLSSGCNAYKDPKNKDKLEKIKAQNATPGFPKASYNLSKWIRRNSADFWKHMQTASSGPALQPYLAFSGVLAGDAHPANFAPILVREFNGQETLKLLDIDFDDAGRGPFVMDFIRLAMITKATKDGVKMSGLLQAYVQGLQGQTMEIPPEVAKVQATKIEDFRQKQDSQLEKRTENHKFKLKAGKIEAYRGPITTDFIQSVLPKFKVLDISLRPKTSDEEEDDEEHNAELRIWVLVHDPDQNRDRHFELKAWRETSLAKYQSQLPTREWLAEIREHFWPGFDGSAYDLIDVPNSGLFWIREKEVTLINVPYSSKKPTATEYVRQFASYDANLLGLVHSRQPGARELLALISTKEQQKAFKTAIKNVMAPYMREIAERVH